MRGHWLALANRGAANQGEALRWPMVRMMMMEAAWPVINQAIDRSPILAFFMTYRSPIKHCRACGAAVAYHVPNDGDTKRRAICPLCHTVHYENPLNVVGTVATWGNQVLLCKRNIEPCWGKWTLPAGFMELHETTAQGAIRETLEEAGALFDVGPLFSLLNVPRVGQVHFFYRATLLSNQFNPGFETIEARLFSEEEIPWEELAFETVKETLNRYFSDEKKGIFGLHCIDIGA